VKRFYTLLKLEYDGLFFPLCIIVAAMAVLQLGLYVRMLQGTEGHVPLAHLIDAGGIPIAFAIAFVCLLVLVAARLAMNYTPSKSMYALLTLPIKRWHVYMAKLASSLLAGFMLLVVQVVLLMAFHALAGMRDASVHGGYEIARRHGDLYLSMLYSNFLRMLFPPGWFARVFFIFGYGGSISVMLFCAAKFKTGNTHAAIATAVGWLILLMHSFVLTDYSQFFGIVRFVLIIGYPISACIEGIKLFEKGEVTG